MPEVTGPTGAASFNREPLWWIAGGQGIIQAVILLLTSFNVPITSAQQAAITGLFIVLGTAWGRSKVWAPVNAQGQPVAVVPKPPVPTPPADEYAYAAKEGTLGQPTDEELLEAYKKRTNG
jgi:hypothetical protein